MLKASEFLNKRNFIRTLDSDLLIQCTRNLLKKVDEYPKLLTLDAETFLALVLVDYNSRIRRVIND